MEPRTPPRNSRSRGTPATPATPRFGTFEDLPDCPRKATPHTGRTHRRKRSLNFTLTPRQTPKRRKDLLLQEEPKVDHSASSVDHSNALKTAYEDEPVSEDDCRKDLLLKFREPESRDKPQFHERGQLKTAGLLNIPGHHDTTDFHDIKRPQDKTGLKDRSDSNSQLTQYHPHRDQPPPDVPGIWYAFRGKKIFRPLPAGEERPEQVTLFKDILQDRTKNSDVAAGGESGSEADTDVEWY